MEQDSLIVFDFLVDSLGFKPEDIIIFGRSIGTGVATYLASQRKQCKLLLLFAPFTNLKAIAKDYVSIFSIFLKDRFPNILRIKDVEAPLLIVHGIKDKIIKVEHSEKLFQEATMKYKKLIKPVEMTHNNYLLYDDLIIPLCQFLKIIQLSKNYNVKSSTKCTPKKVDKKVHILKKLKPFKSDYLFEKENAIYHSFDSEEEHSNDQKEKKKKQNSKVEKSMFEERIDLSESSIKKKKPAQKTEKRKDSFVSKKKRS